MAFSEICPFLAIRFDYLLAWKERGGWKEKKETAKGGERGEGRGGSNHRKSLGFLSAIKLLTKSLAHICWQVSQIVTQ